MKWLQPVAIVILLVLLGLGLKWYGDARAENALLERRVSTAIDSLDAVRADRLAFARRDSARADSLRVLTRERLALEDALAVARRSTRVVRAERDSLRRALPDTVLAGLPLEVRAVLEAEHRVAERATEEARACSLLLENAEHRCELWKLRATEANDLLVRTAAVSDSLGAVNRTLVRRLHPSIFAVFRRDGPKVLLAGLIGYLLGR